MSEFTVHYERKFSDGNYGSEGLSLTWMWKPEGDDEAPILAMEGAIDMLRKQVLGTLAGSTSEHVARLASYEYGKLSRSPVVDEQALAAAEYELQAGLRDAYAEPSEYEPEELPEFK